jgi:anti-sigma regulatory factor (Ser/Thr protein kinase)
MNASPSGLTRWQRRQPVRASRLPRPGSRWRPGSHAGTRHGLEAQLPATPVSAGTARHLTRQLLTDWGLADLADDVLLVTSELATNAITASAATKADAIALWLVRTPDGVLVALADPAAADKLPGWLRLASLRPTPAAGEESAPDELAESGRGLALAAAVAERLGWYRAGKWTVVWAEFSAGDDSAGGDKTDADGADGHIADGERASQSAAPAHAA